MVPFHWAINCLNLEPQFYNCRRYRSKLCWTADPAWYVGLTERRDNKTNMGDDGKRWQKVLQESTDSLKDELNVMPVADYLFSVSVIDRRQYQRIRAGETDYDKADRLLIDVLPKTGSKGFEAFRKALNKYQSWLLKVLDDHDSEVDELTKKTTRLTLDDKQQKAPKGRVCLSVWHVHVYTSRPTSQTAFK